MKLVIDIPEKTNAHIRSDYGHGVKCLRDEDREIVCDAICNGRPIKDITDEQISDAFQAAIASYWEEKSKYLTPPPSPSSPPSPCCDSKNKMEHGEWIPCSKRLPEEEDYRPCYGLPDGCVMWQTDNGDIGFGWYYHSTKCWSDIYDNHIKTGKVIAWMPLPEPYKRGEAE